MNETPKPYHHGDLRRALLDTALEMLGEAGGWQFTLRELARRAGVSHTASYKHFPDKAGLLDELALIGFERLRAALLAANPNPPTSLRDTFMAMSRAYVRFGTANPNLYRLMFSADAHAAMSERLKKGASSALDVLVDMIARGQADGWLRKRPALDQAGASWSQLHGVVLLSVDGLLGPQTVGSQAAEAALEVLLEGMEARHP